MEGESGGGTECLGRSCFGLIIRDNSSIKTRDNGDEKASLVRICGKGAFSKSWIFFQKIEGEEFAALRDYDA
jgi:hypothetical protein